MSAFSTHDQREARESRAPWRAAACRPGCRPRRGRMPSSVRASSPRRARAVAVDAHDARLRESAGQRFLDALRAAAQRLAGRRCRRSGRRAASLLRRRSGGSASRRSAACSTRRALQRVQPARPAAGLAGEHRRVAAPVDEDQALLAARQARADRLEHGLRASRARRVSRAQVDRAHRRQPRAGHGALGQLEQLVAARRGSCARSRATASRCRARPGSRRAWRGSTAASRAE